MILLPSEPQFWCLHKRQTKKASFFGHVTVKQVEAEWPEIGLIAAAPIVIWQRPLLGWKIASGLIARSRQSPTA